MVLVDIDKTDIEAIFNFIDVVDRLNDIGYGTTYGSPEQDKEMKEYLTGIFKALREAKETTRTTKILLNVWLLELRNLQNTQLSNSRIYILIFVIGKKGKK